MAGRNKFPSNLHDFLHDAANKQELFMFLSHNIELMVCREGKQILTTNGTKVIARGTIHQMQECNHKEADTRLLVHLLDTIANGATTCLVCTVDTDVIVIINIAGKLHGLLEQHPASDIWVAFGTGKHFRYVHINAVCSALGNRNPWHFPFFSLFYWL